MSQQTLMSYLQSANQTHDLIKCDRHDIDA